MLIYPFPHCCPCHFSIRCTFKVFHYLLTSSYPLLNALRNRLWRLQVLTLSCESSLSFPFPVLLFFWHGTLPYSAWLFHTLTRLVQIGALPCPLLFLTLNPLACIVLCLTKLFHFLSALSDWTTSSFYDVVFSVGTRKGTPYANLSNNFFKWKVFNSLSFSGDHINNVVVLAVFHLFILSYLFLTPHTLQ